MTEIARYRIEEYTTVGWELADERSAGLTKEEAKAKYEALIQHLKASNVDAIEAFHRSHSDEERYRLWVLAEQYGLGVTVGSDFHSFKGGHRPGHMPVIVKSLPALISSA